MARYIDADKLIAERTIFMQDEEAFDVSVILVSDIKLAPTSDVAEVKHGEWRKGWCDNNLIGHEYEECSVCGCSMLDTNQFWNSKYCPNCGAKMDK